MDDLELKVGIKMKLRKLFLRLLVATLSILSSVSFASAQTSLAIVDHDHSKCNHDHEKPTPTALLLDSFHKVIPGKWKSAEGIQYHFMAERELIVKSKSVQKGKWEMLGSENKITLRLWMPNENNVLSPRMYDVFRAEKKYLSIARLFGETDTLRLFRR